MPELKNEKHSSKSRGPRTTILHLCADVEPDYPGRETVDLAILTQRSGWRALIASAGGMLVPEAERAAVRHTHTPLNSERLLDGWRSRMALERLFRKERPAIIHAHGIETLPFALALSQNHRGPIVFDVTQPLTNQPRARRLLERAKAAQAILRVPSFFMQAHMIEVFQFAEEQVRLVPPGVDLQSFGAGFISPERLQTLSQSLRLPEQAAVIFMPMPLAPDMGHKQLLEALALLKDEPLYAVIAGSDRHAPGQRAALEAQIETLGLGGKVVMPEYCTDMPATCWLSSLVVAPNTAPRGQNLALLAAQAIGRPVLTTKVGANAEFLIKDETGWVLEPGDVHALAEALREGIHFNTQQRLEIADRAHNFIAESFPQGSWFGGMMEIYETMLNPDSRSVRLQAA